MPPTRKRRRKNNNATAAAAASAAGAKKAAAAATSEATAAAAAAAIAATTSMQPPSCPQYDLVRRKGQILDRLEEIKIPQLPNPQQQQKTAFSEAAVVGGGPDQQHHPHRVAVPIVIDKIDTHHDYMLKEMQWLAADFAAERNRHASQRKKLSNGLSKHFANSESRRIRKLVDAELRRRKLAAKLSRQLKGWWTKLDKVVTFKQKIEAEKGRRKSMNAQLVKLVKVTEKYTTDALMSTNASFDDSGSEDEQDDGDDNSDRSGTRRKKKRRRRRRSMSVEEALSEGLEIRRSKARVTDYARLSEKLDKEQQRNAAGASSAAESSLYGESTDATSSDSSWSGGDDSNDNGDGGVDDETTISEAEREELLERRQRRRRRSRGSSSIRSDTDDTDDDSSVASFRADPVELLKLKEEGTMDVQDVVARLKEEGSIVAVATATVGDAAEEEGAGSGRPATRAPGGDQPSYAASAGRKKRVKFAGDDDQVEEATATKDQQQKAAVKPPDPGEDADDDADISDVEDFVNVDEDEEEDDEEFEFAPDDADAVDDETTIAQEEALPKEMTREEEIKMLQEENEISVEELRRMYGAVLSGGGGSQEVADEEHAQGKVDNVEDIVEDRKPPASQRTGTRRRPRASTASAVEPAPDEPRSLTASLLTSTSSGKAVLGASESGENHDDDDDGNEEFRPTEGDLIDDETTLEAEERLGRDMSYEDELALLKRESEMSVDDLRAMYMAAQNEVDEDVYEDDEAEEDEAAASALASLDGPVQEDQENDDEYKPSEDEKDDETTIEAEESLGREMSVEDEIALLKRESEEPVESLVERYRKREPVKEADIVQSNGPEDQDEHKHGDRKENESPEEMGGEEKRDDSEGELSDAGRAALDALEKSAERARRARATRPYLLAPWVRLREYQQVGLNWLVSLHSRRLNGVLADQMGLGKTLQTISLFAYLAAYKGIWGPHLVVVPTSVLLNWETELKRFCPALKVLCYYGPAKTRKELRTGWTKTNWYNVVITSYQLAVQDAFAFKRKKWYYLVLDEAQNIKNFQSQRWQTLINFNTQRRLLLTGTPLQNNLMELWSLLHFLMPYIFRSRKEFSFWFANPMSSMIEGGSKQNDDVVNRLHGIIRPFVLRRLKKDVETQMPGKFEHVIKCQLSRRQMFIYEEFLSRSSTRQALAKGGNFMGMMNVLMQLRKVCLHPDLFEPRAVVTPFVVDPIVFSVPSCVLGLREVSARTDRVSPSVLHPIWCGSTGLPSTEAALRHDTAEADTLQELMDPSSSLDNFEIEDLFPRDDTLRAYPPGLQKLLLSLNEKHKKEKQANLAFLHGLNSSRCQAKPFSYASKALEALNIFDSSPLERKRIVLSTPASLLSMRRDQERLAEDMDEMIRKFVFCVPSASSRQPIIDSNTVRVPGEVSSETLEEMLLEPLEELLRPFRKAQARLTSSFPDKSLIQFDAGKLQTLAELLRELKRGSHRVLIFTQMSKMLDILEAFLNLHGHTYLRLDGSTGVDRRQRLMDRFNSDPKIFCFILSTRSGGLGINLTGADSVIFYDQDWNPAMDAQAQDRAHRIGQTREVHIYRLVTEHTIEENILIKAQQKRNLDILVMDEGKFDASQLFGHGDNAKAASDPEEMKGVFTEGGLRAILGAEPEDTQEQEREDASGERGQSETVKDMEKAMASLEDLDDVQALKGAQKEAAEELKEFDESAEIKKSSDSEDEGDEPANKEKKAKPSPAKKEEKEMSKQGEDGKQEDEDLEKEFAAWQDKVGMDADAIEASLSPAEQYGLRFREEIDPYYSVFAVMEYRRKLEAQQEVADEVDVTAMEREKAIEEKEAIKEGDLLGSRPRPEDLIRQRNLYRREKAKLRADKKRRKLTGENWELRMDALSNLPFWYNIDTGEAIWDKPSTLLELEAYEKAQAGLYQAMPMKPLVHIMSFFPPLPDRMNCSAVCRHWRVAATDASFVRHVYPVEMGAYTRDDSKIHFNHYRSISDALASCLPGDCIELGDGHYWEKQDLAVSFPVRFVGDESNAANVVVEMSGSLRWNASAGWMEGITFRRPKIASAEPSSSPILFLNETGRVDMIQCVFDSRGSRGDVIAARGSGSKGKWEGVAVKGGDFGVSAGDSAALVLDKCGIYDTACSAVRLSGSSEVGMTECEIKRSDGVAFEMTEESRLRLKRCRLSNMGCGVLKKESSTSVSCSDSTITKSAYDKSIPGFRHIV